MTSHGANEGAHDASMSDEHDRMFTLTLGLPDTPDSRAEVHALIRHELDQYRPILQPHHNGGLEITLTIAAADLWLSLLLAMSALTQTGYPPQWVEAMTTSEHRRRRRALNTTSPPTASP
jgi:hypothetical protein